MPHFVELIENQRWYPILGWSSGLKADDPPPWSTPAGTPSVTRDAYDADMEWQVYKSEDYDQDGWLYGTEFGEEWGPMTRSSVVRTRVWMGTKPGKTVAVAESKTESESNTEATSEWKSLFPDGNGATAHTKTDEKYERVITEEDYELFPSSAEVDSKTAQGNELFPLATPAATKTAADKTEEGFFGKMSAAALAFPGSMMNLAGESSKSAVIGTVQSLKEVSLFAFEHAQAATVAAIAAEPDLPPVRQPRARLPVSGDDSNPYEVLSMLSKRFPDLSPVDRSLVSCCSEATPRHLSPPETVAATSCAVCGVEFGMTKFRYVCGYCSESFCHEHLPETQILRAYGYSAPSKICSMCDVVLTQKIDQQLTQWRSERVLDYLADKLTPYYNYSTDRAVDKILRAAGGTLTAAKAAPIGATAKMAVVSADFLRKYGRAGLLGFILRNEFMQSFATLKGLIGDFDDLGFQDAAIGMYYFMAMNRGERGAAPEGEHEEHRTCERISDDLLTEILKYAPLALHAIYELNVLDLQRISRLQKFTLVFAHIQNQDVRHPSFALLTNKETKKALVLIRGSKSVQDLLTDIQAHPEEMGTTGGDGSNSDATGAGGAVDAFAHNGMLKAAMWIKDRIVASLRLLHNEGYQMIFAGHSLGGGCAALLSVMLQKEFAELKCFAYAVPACVNHNVAVSCSDFVHSIVLRDDFVPRAKASNIVKLVDELTEFKGCWRETASEDIEAFKNRAKTLWAPRKREWAREAADQSRGNVTPAAITTPSLAKTEESKDVASDAENETNGDSNTVSSWTLTRTNLIDQMDKSIASDADDSESKVAAGPTAEQLEAEDSVQRELKSTLIDDPKELYIPGQVTHIYFYKGVYEAVHVDRKCAALARIPVFQNMLSDHLGRNYLSALRTVRDVRRMKPTLPEWVPFGTKTRCMCCESPFTWNSTSSSEAQQNRDQHNCRRCGSLVCDGCSEKWKSIPDFGINTPVRVCDRCTYEL